MTENERERALREAARIAAAEAYFAARPASDNPANRRIFKNAFERGWDAQIKNVGIVCTGFVSWGGGGGSGGGSDSLAGTTAPMGKLEAESDGPAIKWVWRDIEP